MPTPEMLARSFFETATVTLHGMGGNPTEIKINLSKRNDSEKNETILGLVRRAEKEHGFQSEQRKNPDAYALTGNSEAWNKFRKEMHLLIIKANTSREAK